MADSAWTKQWRAANREKINASQRAGYAANREHRLAQQKAYYERDAEKILARQRVAYAANPSKYRQRQMFTRHGLTMADYQRLLMAQGGRCATCSETEAGGRGELFHVDHDHGCCGRGKSCVLCRRGLLCSRCNIGIGMFQDDPRVLEAAAAYLRRAEDRYAERVTGVNKYLLKETDE